MNHSGKNLEELNEIWKSGVLEDFVRRMLVYFDPMDLIIMGAPHDEYDSDIGKIIKMIMQEGMTVKQLAGLIFDLYKGNVGDVDYIKKKSLRMAEDLMELKNS